MNGLIDLAGLVGAGLSVFAALMLFRYYGGAVPGALLAAAIAMLATTLAARAYNHWTINQFSVDRSDGASAEEIARAVDSATVVASWIVTADAVSGLLFAATLFAVAYKLTRDPVDTRSHL